MHSRPARRPLFVYAVLLLAASGCSEKPEISSYDAPRKGGSAKENSPGDESRMIAAIFIRDNQAWFLKTMAPKQQVDKAADALHNFAESVALPEDQPAAIEWKVPEGWKEGPPRMMREATLLLPEGDVDVAISKLAFPGDLDDYLKMNINRWRGQLGLEPAEKMDEAAGVREIQVDGQTAWVFDAVGTSTGGGMMPPMMGGNAPFAGPTATPPPNGKPADDQPATTAGEEPAKEEPAAEPAAEKAESESKPKPKADQSRMIAAIYIRGDRAWFVKTLADKDQVDKVADELRTFAKWVKLPEDKPAEIEWNVPEGWQEGPERMMREATLQLPGGDVEVAISQLAFPGDLDEYLKLNINRWRGQLGLDPAEQMNEAAGVEEIEVDGEKAWLFDAVGTSAGGGMMPPMMRRAPFATPGAGATPPESEDE